MEEIISFDESVKFFPVKYKATFNPISGEVYAVGPSIAFTGEKHTIDLENDLAEMIIEGKINIINCAVDIRSMTFELLEKKTVAKIDDILHKIIEDKWSEIDCPDIFLTYNKKKKEFTVELTEEFFGTKKLPKKYQPVTKRKIIWDGETALNFYVTEYNDPHKLYSQFKVLIKDLNDSKIVIKDIDVPSKFTVYTRRVLKNYTIKII
jgi:hypothetical protein